MLRVSRAGYYAWVDRPPSVHAGDDQLLAVRVREIHELTKKRYGAPRVQKELAKAQDIHVSQKRIARLMRQEGLRARPRKRFKCTPMSDHDQPVAANLLDRNFEATAPNQKWVGDTTELLTGNGKLFLAVVLDLYSKFVVGWSLSPVNDRHLTIAALEMAIKRRCPDVGLLHHSDQGCTYASEDYQRILAARGLVCSMSRRGNPYDNAVMEAWNSTFKVECGERFLNNEAARIETFDFIEVFYKSASQYTPRYVRGISSASWEEGAAAGSCRRGKRVVIESSSRRWKIHGPWDAGCIAEIAPASTSRRRVALATST
jgi:transposase InsO family protein